MQTSKYEQPTHPLLEPAIVLPVQFFATIPSGVLHKSGEHKLLWAVLADAIHCFQRFVHATTGAERLLFEEADWWIMHQESQPSESDDGKQRFLFEEVCAALGLDAEYLRIGLRRWRDAQTSRDASVSELG